MAEPHLPRPVKYFVAILYAEEAMLPVAVEALEQHWGPVDYQSKAYPFDQTSYYQQEMGAHLQRRLVSFDQLRSPEGLASAKLMCNELETAHPGRHTARALNLDIGYLDHNKIVLASAKGLGQKIYLSKGIYADLVARYGHGRYQPFEWTFPDFKEGRYDVDLGAMRQRYLLQLKELR